MTNFRQTSSKRRNEDRRKIIVKLAIMLCFGVVVVIWATIAWFSVNKSVDASQASVKTSTLPFDIATTGSDVRHEELIASEREAYVTGTPGTYPNEAGTSGTYYTADSLLLRYAPDADDPTTEDIDESQDQDISPGSSGELNLFVIPKNNNALSINVTLNVVAFAEIDKYVEAEDDPNTPEVESGYVKNGTELIEITNAIDFAAAANAVHNSSVASEAADYVAAAEYLRGHILFFGGEGNTTTGAESTWYYYTTPYTQRVFEQTIAAGNQGKAIQIPIYWMWTNTLGQIALQTNEYDLRSGIPVVQETAVDLTDQTVTDKELILEYLNTNKSSVFMGTETITESMIYAADLSQNFDTLSKQYNAADYQIGTRIAYFLVDVLVESGS